MSDVGRVPFGSIVSLVSDKVTEGKDSSKPYVGLEHIPSGGSSLLGTATAAESVSTNNQFRAGDILFGKLRPRLRKSVRVDFPGYCSTDILVLRAIGSNDPAFAGFVAQSDAVFMDAIRTEEGTKMPRCSWDDLKDINIFCPVRSEQQRIADVLAAINEAIRETKALIAKTEQIKAGLMRDLFTRGVRSDGQLRPAGGHRASRFGPIPQEWTIGSLLDVADLSRQAVLTGPFGADLGNDDFVLEGVPVLRIGNVQAGFLDLSDLLFVTAAKARELRRYVVQDGDLLFARQGATTGRNALATKDVEGCIINYHIIRVALDHSKCAPRFIEAAFNEQVVMRQVARDKGRGTREGINTAQLKALDIPLAPLAEQRKIGELLDAHAQDLASLENGLLKLQDLKAGVMRDLLTGRVRVSSGDAHKAAASV